MEAVEVTVRFQADGTFTPISLSRQAQSYAIVSTGRRWEDEQGRHILVMIPGGRVFELIFIHEETRWLLRKIAPDQPMV